jgi:hypothetical protein
MYESFFDKKLEKAVLDRSIITVHTIAGAFTGHLEGVDIATIELYCEGEGSIFIRVEQVVAVFFFDTEPPTFED